MSGFTTIAQHNPSKDGDCSLAGPRRAPAGVGGPERVMNGHPCTERLGIHAALLLLVPAAG